MNIINIDNLFPFVFIFFTVWLVTIIIEGFVEYSLTMPFVFCLLINSRTLLLCPWKFSLRTSPIYSTISMGTEVFANLPNSVSWTHATRFVFILSSLHLIEVFGLFALIILCQRYMLHPSNFVVWLFSYIIIITTTIEVLFSCFFPRQLYKRDNDLPARRVSRKKNISRRQVKSNFGSLQYTRPRLSPISFLPTRFVSSFSY